METTSSSPEPKQACLVCHVPEDAGWAAWLVEEMDAYRVPRKLVGHLNRRGERIRASVGPVRRFPVKGEAELEAKQLERLAGAGFVIVVCSAAAARSAGLGACLRYFKSIGRSDRIIAAIVDGVPSAPPAAAAEECFHQALRFEVDQEGRILELPAEPLAADFRIDGRHPGWYDLEEYAEALEELGRGAAEIESSCANQGQRIRLMRLKLLAGILGLNLGELTERDKAYQAEVSRRRVLRVLLTLLVFALLVFGLVRGAGILSDYRSAAAKAAEAAQVAQARSIQAEQERREADARNLKQAESLRLAEEKAKGLGYLDGSNGLPRDRALALRHLGVAAAGGDAGANLWLAKLMVEKEAADAETSAGLEKLFEVRTGAAVAEATEAAFLLGRIYSDGKLVPQDRTKAIEHMEFSAASGYAPAMEPLAYMLERGWGGAAKAKEALGWYERAAAAESPEGLFALYLINLQGRPVFGVVADAAKAAAFLDRATKAGSPRALYQSSLALKDPAEVENMLERSAKAGEPRSRHALVGLYLNGDRGHAVVVDKGVFHAGVALELAVQAKDTKSANYVANMLMRGSLHVHCASIRPQLRKAAEMGSTRAGYVYALSCGLGEDGKLSDLETYKAFMSRAAEAGLAEAQYDFGKRAAESALPGVAPEVGATWLEKAARQGYPPAWVLAAQNRRPGGLLAKDWAVASEFMNKAARFGLEVDWSSMPRRFRPADSVPKAGAADAPSAPKLSAPSQEKLAGANLIIGGKARRSKESVELVLKLYPVDAAWSEEKVHEIGVMLMSVGRYDDGVAYLSRAVLRSEPLVSHEAARMLANYFEATKPASAYQWYLVAQSRSFKRNTEIALSRIRLAEPQRETALTAAAMVVASDLLQSAAEAAGYPDQAQGLRKKTEVAVVAPASLLKQADALLAKSEFPEEAEDAAKLYEEVLASSPGDLAAMNGLYRSSRLLLDEKKAYYWCLRSAYAKRPSADSAFEYQVALAEAFAAGAGVRADALESAKWLSLARAELSHAEALAAGLGEADESKRRFAAAKKSQAELEQSRTVAADDPALGLRLKMHRAYLAQAAKR